MAAKTKATSKKVEKKTILCDKGCLDKPKSTGSFYISSREEYESYGGFCTTCKSCLKKETIDYNLGVVTPEKLRPILKKLNRPYIESIFLEVKSIKNMTNDRFLGKYLSILNLKPKYKDCVYSDTVDIEIEQEKLMNSKVEQVSEISVTEEIKRFWGRGLEDQDYIDLQTMFEEYTAKENNMTKKKQDDYKSLCIYELQKSKIQFNLDKITDTQKLQGLIDNLSSSLGIQTIQKQDDDKNDRFTLGLLARYHEDILKKPIRRFVEDLGGVDPIQKKIEVYYKGGILNAMGIVNPDMEKYKEEVEQYTVKLKEVENEIRKEKEGGVENG